LATQPQVDDDAEENRRQPAVNMGSSALRLVGAPVPEVPPPRTLNPPEDTTKLTLLRVMDGIAKQNISAIEPVIREVMNLGVATQDDDVKRKTELVLGLYRRAIVDPYVQKLSSQTVSGRRAAKSGLAKFLSSALTSVWSACSH